MKLFFYDSKHEQVYGELELGELIPAQVELVDKITEFLEKQGLTDGRYRNLVLANGYEMIVNEDQESEIKFN